MSEFDYQLGRFTGTSARIVMNGSEYEWVEHYLLRSGQLQPEPPNWAMRVGSHMEPLILDWYQERLGHPITRRGEVVYLPDDPDVCAKLDGYCAHLDLILEVKFLAPHFHRDQFVPLHYAQTMLQRLCTGASRAALLVAQGTAEPLDFEHPFDADYAGELLRRKDIFLNCLRTLTPPYPIPPAPPPPEKWRTLDIIAQPTNWSGELLLYLEEYDSTAAAAKQHEEVGKAARDLIPDDVGKVLAGAFQISRDRKGKLSIRRAA
ncbi:hypothetical protein A1D31_22535 [Bradyrhizobium liaoningense]|nr:hypothetical protein A1D31_22535 [Bradyrhizobium liaoningense]